VACRSQDNPRHTVPDGVPPRAANLGFSTCLLSKAVRPTPRRLDRPVLGGSASGFLTTTRASAFVCLTGKSVNTFRDSAGDNRYGFTTDLSIFAWDHSAILAKKCDHGEYRGTQRGRPEEVDRAARVHQATISLWRHEGSFK
jgi:hypothetical protein